MADKWKGISGVAQKADPSGKYRWNFGINGIFDPSAFIASIIAGLSIIFEGTEDDYIIEWTDEWHDLLGNNPLVSVYYTDGDNQVLVQGYSEIRTYNNDDELTQITLNGLLQDGVIYLKGIVGSSVDIEGAIAAGLQAQISNKAVRADLSTGTDQVKIPTSKSIYDYWAWIKTQAQTITAKWLFNTLRFVAGATPGALTDGDIWYENTDKRLRFRKNAQNVDFIFSADNQPFLGVGDRIIQTNSLGDLSAPNEIIEQDVSDTDIIAAIIGASYDSGNGFTASIAPVGKFMYNGQRYKAGSYLYLAVSDNTVFRISGG